MELLSIISPLIQAPDEIPVHMAGLEFYNSEVTHELDSFKSRCDVIIVNRMVDELDDVKDKVFTRDLFGND